MADGSGVVAPGSRVVALDPDQTGDNLHLCICGIVGQLVVTCLLDCSSSLTIAIIVLLKITVNRVCEKSQIIFSERASVVHIANL